MGNKSRMERAEIQSGRGAKRELSISQSVVFPPILLRYSPAMADITRSDHMLLAANCSITNKE